MVFVREIVPRYAIAKVAQMVYGERYIALPMRHRVAGPTSEGGRVNVEYGWRIAGRWNTLRMQAEGRPALAAAGSLQQFITEHYWGYARQRDGADHRISGDARPLAGLDGHQRHLRGRLHGDLRRPISQRV